MKKILLGHKDTVSLNEINVDMKIFAKRHDRLVGMVTQMDKRWGLLVGGKEGTFVFVQGVLQDTITQAIHAGYEFFVA